MEEEATRFAAEFLMPERDIRPELERLTLDRLIGLKIRWSVSMQAILKRAETLAKLTPRQARYLWMQISKAGFRTREPIEADVALEEPRLLAEIVNAHRYTLGLSPQDIADLIAVNPRELGINYGIKATPLPERTRLRLVSSR